MATKLLKALLVFAIASLGPMAASQVILRLDAFRINDDGSRTEQAIDNSDDCPNCLTAATQWIFDHFSFNDDNVRMEQMLYASEDLRHVREEWRRFWFTDMPSHQTPQRVHGGIYP